MNIQEFDIFHGGIYYVDEEKEDTDAISLGYGGFVRFNAFCEEELVNFEPMHPEGCWAGMKYDGLADWQEYSKIEGALLAWPASLDMLEDNGDWDFSEWKDLNRCTLLDKERHGERRIELQYKGNGVFSLNFIELPDLFDKTKHSQSYQVTYMHELQRLMIIHGWGKSAIDLAFNTED